MRRRMAKCYNDGMKTMLHAFFLIFVFAPLYAANVTIQSLCGEWEFHMGDTCWRRVTVPHDWAIAGPFDIKGSSATGKLPWKGEGVYRRSFEAAALKDGETARLEFDGVMARPEVFLNGVRVGGWDYGYMGFTCDVTSALRSGTNEVEVRASTKTHGSRWYPGGGIYRSVRFVVASKDATLPGTMFIRLERLEGGAAHMLATWETSAGSAERRWTVEKPVLWTPENPKLYTVRLNGEEFRYGIRTCAFTANDGFHLNGKRYQIKGANLHSDLGPLGMAFHKGAARRQLEIMKEMGVNAIRTAHNPPDPQFLELCDEMGFLVWDECFDKWNDTASRLPEENLETYVVRNLRAFVRRDRNHPCVICWSISNEIGAAGGNYKDGQTKERVAMFAAAVREEDATRPVGSGNCHPEWFGDKSIFAPLDVTGWNYQHAYAVQHAFNPDTQAVVMTESSSAVSSAGWYGEEAPANKYDYATNVTEICSYDCSAVPFGDIPDVEFHRIEKDAYCAGHFVWTGIDYLGEPSPYDYVIKGLGRERESRSSYFGCVDLAGFPKNRFWLYRSLWNEQSHTLRIVAGGRRTSAWVYTDADEAELFADGKSLGRKQKLKDVDYPLDFIRMWPRKASCKDNPYYAVCDKYRLRWFDIPEGTKELVAVAYRNGKQAARTVSKRPGPAARIVVKREKERDGLVYFRISMVDREGTLVDTASEKVSFSLSGPGRLIAVGNGDARGYESFADVSSHSLYCGRAIAIAMRTGVGELTLKAELAK